MNKKTAFGTAATAAALIVVGAAAPAMASDGDYSSISKWSSRATSSTTDTTTVFAPSVDVLNGDLLNGHSLGSGNELNAPLLSGNDTALGNGNTTELGNITGNDVSTSVSDVVDNATHTSVSDIIDVNDVLGDVSGWVDLSSIFED